MGSTFDTIFNISFLWMLHTKNIFCIIFNKIMQISIVICMQMNAFIADNFLTFWFRFFYKHMNYVESGSMGLLKQIFLRDYPTFSGMMLERYFRQQAKESGLYTSIGNFWDRKGGHEMDIILANELDRTLRMGEVKRQAKYFNPRLLQEKSEYFLSVNPQLHSYRCELFSLDMDDM